ncbi:MmcQ/YjbR family DNA-binding protein [Knoellia koreensis]|uniref:MmcQ/YjbR family DNA-binding protein n=1 Tax=Knoellia koreensis TaxID=2730921 RepID=A0A849HFP1_9MICO|nr:MmcQ/YjbR family DNA-binding protein [Knoellia sp. DB2414S]NNM46238.1 MmcQ/YjbR family DNA-binding protein [Knoellia sp. DB2414S]
MGASTEADDLSPAVVARLGEICLALPQAVEQDAWRGVRWRIRQRTFAHVAHVDPADGSVFSQAAPVPHAVDVVTFRSSGEELESLVRSGYPFYKPQWSPTVVGLAIEHDVDWAEVAELLTESYCLMAPRRLARLVAPPSG